MKIGVFFFGLAALASLAVMVLWNWLMPALIGATTITWLQALGLLALSRLLFGSHCRHKGRGRGHRGMKHGRWKKRWMERYQQMSPEEKEKFKERFRGRCGKGQGWGGEWPWKETVEEVKYDGPKEEGKGGEKNEQGDPFVDGPADEASK